MEIGFVRRNDCCRGTVDTRQLPKETQDRFSKNYFPLSQIFDARKFSAVFLKLKKSMFCNYEKISCEILNTAIGPDHAKIAIAELKLTLRKYGKGTCMIRLSNRFSGNFRNDDSSMENIDGQCIADF